uniref:KRAB domain-containing protein n=1 Tax=Strix occidentalis caurina TaxID=311401 RepID=A0A8D0FUW9_STROC
GAAQSSRDAASTSRASTPGQQSELSCRDAAPFLGGSGPALPCPAVCFPRGSGGAGEAPRRWLLCFQVTAACEDDAASLPEQEWGSLESRQKELYRIAMKGSYEAVVVSLGEAQSLPVCQTHYYPRGRIQRTAARRLLRWLGVRRRTGSER